MSMMRSTIWLYGVDLAPVIDEWNVRKCSSPRLTVTRSIKRGAVPSPVTGVDVFSMPSFSGLGAGLQELFADFCNFIFVTFL